MAARHLIYGHSKIKQVTHDVTKEVKLMLIVSYIDVWYIGMQVHCTQQYTCNWKLHMDSQTATRLITWARTNPERANVVKRPSYRPFSSKWPMLICTEAWSLAVIILFVAELQEQKFNLSTQQNQPGRAETFLSTRWWGKRTTSWGRRGPPSYPPRSAWW